MGANTKAAIGHEKKLGKIYRKSGAIVQSLVTGIKF